MEMLKEFQDAAQIAERKEKLNTLLPAIAGMIFTLTLILATLYVTIFTDKLG